MSSVWQRNLPTVGSSTRDRLKCSPENWEVLAKHPMLLITGQCAVEIKADVDSHSITGIDTHAILPNTHPSFQQDISPDCDLLMP